MLRAWNWGRRSAVGAWATGVLLAGGCATVYPPAPYQAAETQYEYRIGPGDRLSLVVWQHPELSMLVPVRPDGRISAPLVEDLEAAGKDPASLAREIAIQLARHVSDPVVSVIVTDFGAADVGRVRVTGEVIRPLAMQYVRGMTLVDALIAAQGITDRAAGNRATILRTSEGNKQYSIRIEDLVNRGDASANVELRPGDILMIPRRR